MSRKTQQLLFSFASLKLKVKESALRMLGLVMDGKGMILTYLRDLTSDVRRSRC